MRTSCRASRKKPHKLPQGSYGWFSMALIPSSTVKTVPHFGHFTFVSFEAYPAQPRVKAAINATARTKLMSLFTSLHLPSIIQKNSLWGGLNIQKSQLCVKGILAQDLRFQRRFRGFSGVDVGGGGEGNFNDWRGTVKLFEAHRGTPVPLAPYS